MHVVPPLAVDQDGAFRPRRCRRWGSRKLSRGHRLRLLSYNIQMGIACSHYGHYVTRSWRHLMPNRNRWRNLDGIARCLAPYHVVALQETDSGSLRTGYTNQTQYLAERSDFPYWFDQVNRRVGNLTRHSNGLLSRFRPHSVTEHRLPGLPGRGALLAQFGDSREPIAVFVMHLALGRRARLRQIGYLVELVNEYEHVIFMGDLNFDVASAEMRQLLRCTRLKAPTLNVGTFPSWQPRRNIDHILVTPAIRIERVYVPRWTYSDHLPIAMEAIVPASL